MSRDNVGRLVRRVLELVLGLSGVATRKWRKVAAPIRIRYQRLASRHAFMRTLWFRVTSYIVVASLIISPLYVLVDNLIQGSFYKLSDKEAALVGHSTIDTKLIKQTATAISYNRSSDTGATTSLQQVLTSAANQEDATGKISYQAELPKSSGDSIVFADSSGSRKIQLTPTFTTYGAELVDGRVIYPSSSVEKHIYSFKNNGIKSDIVLAESPGANTKTYAWKLDLGTELEARLLPNGGVGIYSGNPMLYGNVQTADQSSQALLDKARSTSQKDYLIFELPKPFILDGHNQTNYQDSHYALSNNTLTLTVTNLKQQTYPLSIDPTITVNTTAGFQQNNGDAEGADLATTPNQITRAASEAGMVGVPTTNATGFTTARSGHTSLVYNGYAYIIGGTNGTYQNDIQHCPVNGDGSIGTCVQQTSAFTTARSGHTSVVYNGYLYIIGGTNGTNQNDIQHCLINPDGSVGTCVQQTAAFTTARSGHTSVVYNGYLYVIGGTNGTNQNDIQYCSINGNGSVGACTQQTSAFTTARSVHSSVVYNGYLYVLGGVHATSDTLCNAAASTYCSDIQYVPIAPPVPNAIQNPTVMTTVRYSHASLVYNGYLYLIGGMNGSVYLGDIEYCPISPNGSVGTCVTNATGFTSARISLVAVAYNGYLYLAAGFAGAYYSDIQYCPFNANGSVGACTQQVNMLTAARDNPTAVVYNGYLYIIGGYNGSYFNDVQICQLTAAGPANACIQQTNVFPTARSSHATVLYNGYFYIIGGYNGVAEQNDIVRCQITSSNTVGTCTQQANAFTSPRSNHSAEIINGTIYIITGYHPTLDTACSTASQNRCSSIQACPINPSDMSVGMCVTNKTAIVTGRENAASAFYNGYVYETGGYNGSAPLNDIQYIQVDVGNGGQGATTQQTNAFTTPRSGHTSVVYNGYLYVVGGNTGSYQNDIQYCPMNPDGSVGTCVQQTNAFTTPRSGHASVAYNGYLYIIGGTNGTNQNDIIHCPINSNGSVGTCVQQTSAFTSIRSGHTSVVYNGYLYIIGGASSINQNDIQHCLINGDGSVGACVQQTAAFTTARYGHTSVVYNGYLYIIGGTSGTSQNDIQYCHLNNDGSVGTCATNATGFTTARYAHTSVVYDGYLYVVGGWDGTTRQNDIQYLPFNTIQAAAYYERVFDAGAGVRTLTSFTINGAVTCNNYKVTYRIGDSSGVFGSSTTLTGVAPGVAQSLGSVAARYLLVGISADDSSCNGAQSNMTSISMTYNAMPSAPTLISPAASATSVSVTPELRVGTIDLDSDYLKYRINVCSDSACSSILRTIDQTSSQTGWVSQGAQTGTAYTSGPSLTQIAIHQYQTPELTANTQYWWRAQAIDPAGVNQWSGWSSINSFTTAPVSSSNVNIGGGGVIINGNSKITTGN